MSTLVLSPSRQPAGLEVTEASAAVLSLPSLQWQLLPPLLSRLPPALLASPSSAPTPIAPLQSSSECDPNITHQTASSTTEGAKVGYTLSHLPAIDEASLALHYALYKFRVLDVENYATEVYEKAFNWGEIELPIELEREWYIVAFRSIRKKGADTALLYQADREAHEEAVTAGGLLLYWYGSPNEAGKNLATCIWQSRKHALVANRNPKHAVAARLAHATYETYNLERYILRKVKGSTFVTVVPWDGGDVGY